METIVISCAISVAFIIGVLIGYYVRKSKTFGPK